MIVFKCGDIFDSHTDIIAHQVNCRGVMGAGLALALRKQFPSLFTSYVNFCKKEEKKGDLLGKVYICRCEDVDKNNTRYIANLFGQSNYGVGKCQTDYLALQAAFFVLREQALKNHWSIAIPCGIGCGLAGGDWRAVSEIIYNIFGDSNCYVEIWKKY